MRLRDYFWHRPTEQPIHLGRERAWVERDLSGALLKQVRLRDYS
jgi:hypothetical protein